MEGAPVVLVIEDEEPSQEIVHDALQEGGFDATTERPNLRQNAVFGQTVRVSSTVDVATHRPAAMAVARVGAAKARPRAHSRTQHPLSSQSRNARPSGVICQPELSRTINP
jgi:hypothetical protein